MYVAIPVIFILGVIVGILVHKRFEKKPVGDLRVDQSDPDSMYFFLEINREEYNQIQNGAVVSLRVKFESYLPRN